MSDSPHKPEAHRRHASRKTRARLELAGIFVLLALSFSMLALLFFSVPSGRPFVGVLFGGVIASTLLLGAVWNRQSWARVVLVALLLLLAAYFGLGFLVSTGVVLSSTTNFSRFNIAWYAAGVGGLVLASVWLGFSRRIRHLTTPPGSGG